MKAVMGMSSPFLFHEKTPPNQTLRGSPMYEGTSDHVNTSTSSTATTKCNYRCNQQPTNLVVSLIPDVERHKGKRGSAFLAMECSSRPQSAPLREEPFRVSPHTEKARCPLPKNPHPRSGTTGSVSIGAYPVPNFNAEIRGSMGTRTKKNFQISKKSLKG